jgi:hypothetical protein
MRFEKPDAEARAALWRKVFPSSCQMADDVDFDKIGELYEISGGNIRNAAVRAAFLAASASNDEGGEGKPIDQATILLAAEKEAREMGLLTRSHLQKTQFIYHEDEPADPASDTASDIAEMKKKSARLVPITRPRRPR